MIPFSKDQYIDTYTLDYCYLLNGAFQEQWLTPITKYNKTNIQTYTIQLNIFVVKKINVQQCENSIGIE